MGDERAQRPVTGGTVEPRLPFVAFVVGALDDVAIGADPELDLPRVPGDHGEGKLGAVDVGEPALVGDDLTGTRVRRAPAERWRARRDDRRGRSRVVPVHPVHPAAWGTRRVGEHQIGRPPDGDASNAVDAPPWRGRCRERWRRRARGRTRHRPRTPRRHCRPRAPAAPGRPRSPAAGAPRRARRSTGPRPLRPRLRRHRPRPRRARRRATARRGGVAGRARPRGGESTADSCGGSDVRRLGGRCRRVRCRGVRRRWRGRRRGRRRRRRRRRRGRVVLGGRRDAVPVGRRRRAPRPRRRRGPRPVVGRVGWDRRRRRHGLAARMHGQRADVAVEVDLGGGHPHDGGVVERRPQLDPHARFVAPDDGDAVGPPERDRARCRRDRRRPWRGSRGPSPDPARRPGRRARSAPAPRRRRTPRRRRRRASRRRRSDRAREGVAARRGSTASGRDRVDAVDPDVASGGVELDRRHPAHLDAGVRHVVAGGKAPPRLPPLRRPHRRRRPRRRRARRRSGAPGGRRPTGRGTARS